MEGTALESAHKAGGKGRGWGKGTRRAWIPGLSAQPSLLQASLAAEGRGNDSAVIQAWPLHNALPVRSVEARSRTVARERERSASAERRANFSHIFSLVTSGAPETDAG